MRATDNIFRKRLRETSEHGCVVRLTVSSQLALARSWSVRTILKLERDGSCVGCDQTRANEIDFTELAVEWRGFDPPDLSRSGEE